MGIASEQRSVTTILTGTNTENILLPAQRQRWKHAAGPAFMPGTQKLRGDAPTASARHCWRTEATSLINRCQKTGQRFAKSTAVFNDTCEVKTSRVHRQLNSGCFAVFIGSDLPDKIPKNYNTCFS